MKHPRDMSAAEKKAWAARMRRLRKKNPANPRRRRTTTRRRRTTRKSPTTRRRRYTRKKNPRVLGVDVMPAAIDVGGVAAGAMLGAKVAGFIRRNLVERLPMNLQAVGYALGGLGLIILGHYGQKKYSKWPMVPFAAALATPLLLEGLSVAGIMGGVTTVAVQDTNGETVQAEVETATGRVRRVRGRTARGMLVSKTPLATAGTMYQSRAMAGTIASKPTIPMGRGWTGPTL